MGDAELMRQMYGDDVNAFLGFAHSHMGYWLEPNTQDFGEAQEELLRQVATRLDLTAGDTVLDIGGGQGGTAIFLAEHYGVRVTLVDVVEEMVDAARRKVESAGLADRISCVHDDITGWETDQRFDALIAVESVYHIADQGAFFAKAASLLTPASRFCFTTYVSELRPRVVSNAYLVLTVGDRDIPTVDDYREAARSTDLDLEVEDVTRRVLPTSSELLQREPYWSRLAEYHRVHMGRWAVWLMPLFRRWNNRTIRNDRLRYLLLTGGPVPPR